MSNYNATFTRYKDFKRIRSGDEFFTADDFNDAVRTAKGILLGMRLADRDAEFDIAEIRCTGLGGEQASVGFGDTEKEKPENS